jgi:hypothetical protein
MRKVMMNPPSTFCRNGRLMRGGAMPRSLTQDYPGQFKQRNSAPGVAATPLRAGSTAKWSRVQTRMSPRAPMHIMGAGRTQNGLGMKSRLPIIWLRQAWGKRDSGVEGRILFGL